jgi:hypothetical protein
LAPAFEQILISRVLNKRVLEPIIRVWRQALHQQDVRLGEPVERRLQRCVFHASHSAKEPVGKVASDHSADLSHLARRAKTIQPRR